MWIFNQYGFFSVVQHRDDADAFMIRSRRREDLERMLTQIGEFPALAIANGALIMDDRNGDYRWRVKVERHFFNQFMVDALNDIEYTTGVKDHIDQGDPDYHTALYGVWSAMMKLQDGGRYAGWSDPADYDAAEFVEVREDGEGLYNVVVLDFSMRPKAKSIGEFTDVVAAELLAEAVRDTLGTWPGFTSKASTPHGYEPRMSDYLPRHVDLPNPSAASALEQDRQWKV